MTTAHIHLGKLAANARAVAKRVAPAKVIPVVKADAYGHGAVRVTKRLVEEGFSLFAVAHLEEALELRESGIDASILILGRLWGSHLETAVRSGFSLSVFDTGDLEMIEKVCPDQQVKIHVKVDTGMGRVGLLPGDVPELFGRIDQAPHLQWEGLYSHFATADEADKSYSEYQLAWFRAILSGLERYRKRPALVHLANSGAILDLPDSYFDAVRPGILLYGHYPSAETGKAIIPSQVMTLKTVVTHVRDLPADSAVSYGREWITEEDTRVAVLAIGYADGVPRVLGNKGEVLIRGVRFPIVGRVTMDLTMVHVGDAPVAPGDEAVIWGDTSGGSITALEVAEKAGTIPYELTCGVTRRVPRVYSEE